MRQKNDANLKLIPRDKVIRKLNKTKYTNEIQVTEFTFLTTKKESESSSKQNLKLDSSESGKMTNFDGNKEKGENDDLPF